MGTVIANFISKDTGEAWPSRATLTSITGIDDREVVRVVHELKAAGFLAISERSGHSNIYHLTYGEIPTCGEIPTVGKQPQTCGEIVSKPVVKSPPIYKEEQEIYKEDAQNKIKTAKKPRISKPKICRDDSGFSIPAATLKAWEKAYPGVDVNREAAKAFAWCLANPRKAPKKNYDRFLNAWLSRAKPTRDPEVMLDPNADYELSPDDRALIIAFEKEQARKVVANA
jgi:hypothetical protein